MIKKLILFVLYQSSSFELALSYVVSSPAINSNIKSTTCTVYETSFTLSPDHDQRRDLGVECYNGCLQFDYGFNEIIMNRREQVDDDKSNNYSSGSNSRRTRRRTTIVLLIHPIGVGISRWYYDRLLNELPLCYDNTEEDGCTQFDKSRTSANLIFLTPDLLGCGTACNPRFEDDDCNKSTRDDKAYLPKLPLLKVNDWADQLIDLMRQYESKLKAKNDHDQIENEVNWCVVSNGGCVPIALEIGQRLIVESTIPTLTTSTISPITNLILSATPSANSLFNEQNWDKVQKSYRILSGIPGSLFWWYALRNNGEFIQSFSEKNLAAKPENLGSNWTPTCVTTAKRCNGQSRFSTFAFLAGSLNGGNNGRLSMLKGTNIDVITGSDTRRNRARSWFWDRRKRSDEEDIVAEKTTLVPILRENDISGREFFVGGRRCPAHEDAHGFGKVLLQIITE